MTFPMRTSSRMPNERGLVTAAVCDCRAAHPDWTLAQIAADCGTTRQRVHQILAREGLPTRARRAAPSRPSLLCSTCGTVLHVQVAHRDTGGLLCRSCRNERGRVSVQCTECGRVFSRQRARHNRSLARARASGSDSLGEFCDNVCWGRFMGKHFGRGRTRIQAKL